jgi:outer membrane protein
MHPINCTENLEMKKTALALLIAATFAPSLAFAEAGDWVVRMRAVNINPDEDSNLTAFTAPPSGGARLDGDLTVDSNTIPEWDISYYVTKNIAVELILALGSKHDVNLTSSKLNGQSAPSLNENLGEVNVLPPTLTVQWHFNPDQMIDPYVGAGINYTRFMDKNLNHTVGGDIEVDRNSWGGALQVGVDVNLKDGWQINADVKKLWIDTDVSFSHGNGIFPKQKIDSLDIDPWVFGLGVGKRF